MIIETESSSSLFYVQRKGGLIPLPAEIPSSTASTRWLRKSCDGISMKVRIYRFFRVFPASHYSDEGLFRVAQIPIRLETEIRLRMVSCCEIHPSRLLMCFHLISNIGPVSEKISNQGPSSTAADALWVDIRFRETNEVIIYLVGPQYSSFALDVHTFFRYGFDAEILLEKKKYQSAE
jgi:hypothetical protein